MSTANIKEYKDLKRKGKNSMNCVCTRPAASFAYCEKCKGHNSVGIYHKLRFELLCRLYDKRKNIRDFSNEEIDSIRSLMQKVTEFAECVIREANIYSEKNDK